MEKIQNPKTNYNKFTFFTIYPLIPPSNPLLLPFHHFKNSQNTLQNPLNPHKSPQSHPIIANIVENLTHPFIFSLSDFGNLPEKPHKNIQRMLKNKPFRKPDISETVQSVLDKFKEKGKMGIFIDVGANVGMATFAAAVMGFKVVAFEPVFENLQRVCDGIYNRVPHLVTVFDLVVSDHVESITFHKLVGRLDNSAVSATGSSEDHTIPLDDVRTRGSTKNRCSRLGIPRVKGLLSRKGPKAPCLIYEEDERLLEASNSTAKEIRDFLESVGYNHCTQNGTYAHCTKTG